MSDPLRPIRPGDPIRAEMLNAVIDGTKTIRQSTRSGGSTLDGPATSSVLVRILNDTGEDLDRFAVVEISEPIFSPDDNEDEFFKAPAFLGKKPGTATDCKFAILQRPAMKNEIVPGCVAGVSVVKLTVQNESDEFASPGTDPDAMQTATEGAARILWKESGTDERWGIVSFPVGGTGGTSTQYAVVMEAISQPEDVTAEPPSGMGKIKVLGKNYPTEDENGDPIEPKYDDCACLYLAETEVAVVGMQVKVTGPYQYDNPEFDPQEDEDNENPKKKTYYLVADWDQEWIGELTEDVDGGQSTTIEVSDLTGSAPAHQCTVWNDLVYADDMIASGVSVKFRGMTGTNGNRLQIIGDACPLPKINEQEEEE